MKTMTTFNAKNDVNMQTAVMYCPRGNNKQVKVQLSKLGQPTRNIIFYGPKCRKNACKFIQNSFKGFEIVKTYEN